MSSVGERKKWVVRFGYGECGKKGREEEICHCCGNLGGGNGGGGRDKNEGFCVRFFIFIDFPKMTKKVVLPIIDFYQGKNDKFLYFFLSFLKSSFLIKSIIFR